MKPKVSVIIPVYNGSEYIDDCLIRLCGQTLKEIEIICVDDGSTDNSAELISAYAERDNRVILIKENHENAGHARNAGLKKASGKYLYFIDIDDFPEENALEVLYSHAEETGAQVTLFRFDAYMNERKIYLPMDWVMKQGLFPDKPVFSFSEIRKDRLCSFSGLTIDKLFLHEYIEENGFEFQQMRTCNDGLFVYSTMMSAERISLCYELLAHQRRETRGTLSATAGLSWDCFGKMLFSLRDFLSGRNQYRRYERDFVNLAAVLMRRNIVDIKGEGKKKAYDTVKSEWVEDFGFTSHGKDYFYSDIVYDYLSAVIKKTYSEFFEEKTEGVDISFIVPVFGKAYETRECVDSILSQRGCSVEAVLVGTEKDRKDCIGLFGENKKINFCIIQDKKNIFNAAVRSARGEFVSFLEYDDKVKGTWTGAQRLCSFARQSNAQAVLTCHPRLGERITVDYLDTDKTYSGQCKEIIHLVDMLRHRVFKREYLLGKNISVSSLHSFLFCATATAERVCFLNNRLFGSSDFDVYTKYDREKVSEIRQFLEKNSNSECTVAENFVYKEYAEKTYEKYCDLQDGEKDGFIAEIRPDFIRAGIFGRLDTENLRDVVKDFVLKLSEKTGDPAVSVIMPVYNTEKYLRECLDSLLNQNFTDFEVLCVDDGSTDASVQILEEYARNDSRFRVLRQQNMTAGAARNRGIENARGEYLLFLDSDDFFSPDLVGHAWARAGETNADVTLFNALKFNDSTRTSSEAPHFFRKQLFEDMPVFSRHDIPEVLLRTTSPSPWLKIFRRQFILDNSLEFQCLSNSNDVYFTTLALCCAERISWLDEFLVYYRVGMSGNTQSRKNKAPLNFIKAYTAIYRGLNERGLYPQLEKTYTDFAVSGITFNLKTISDLDARALVFGELNRTILPETGIADKPDSYYNILENVQLIRGTDSALKWYNKLNSLKEDRGFRTVKEASHGENAPLVSVVIPVYNVEAYLRPCLDSIVNQTLKDIEIICINDGSPDESPDILKEYAERDSRISVFTQENCGLSCTRNRGLGKASGKYVYYMDSDDILEPDALELLSKKMDGEKLDVLFFDAVSFSDDEDCETALYDDYYIRKGSYNGSYSGIELCCAMLRAGEFRSSACLQMARRDFLLQNSLSFYEGILHEDNLYTFKVMLAAKSAGYIPETLFNRRVRQSSIMTEKVRFEHVYGYFICHCEMMKVLRESEIPSEYAEELYSFSGRILDNARSKYFAVSPEEKTHILLMDGKMRAVFKMHVSDYVAVKNKLEKTLEFLQIKSDKVTELYEAISELKKDAREKDKIIQSLKERS